MFVGCGGGMERAGGGAGRDVQELTTAGMFLGGWFLGRAWGGGKEKGRGEKRREGEGNNVIGKP